MYLVTIEESHEAKLAYNEGILSIKFRRFRKGSEYHLCANTQFTSTLGTVYVGQVDESLFKGLRDEMLSTPKLFVGFAMNPPLSIWAEGNCLKIRYCTSFAGHSYKVTIKTPMADKAPTEIPLALAGDPPAYEAAVWSGGS